jgi:hypothetical protein
MWTTHYISDLATIVRVALTISLLYAGIIGTNCEMFNKMPLSREGNESNADFNKRECTEDRYLSGGRFESHSQKWIYREVLVVEAIIFF